MSSSSIFTDTPRDKVSSVFCTFFIPVKDTHPIAHQKVISDLKEKKNRDGGILCVIMEICGLIV